MNKEYGFEQRVPLNFCNFCGKGKNWAQVIIKKKIKNMTKSQQHFLSL